MTIPDTIPVRIKKTHAECARSIGKRLKKKRSVVLDTALTHGMPIARQLLAKKG